MRNGYKHFQTIQLRYLRTAPNLPMVQLVVAGQSSTVGTSDSTGLWKVNVILAIVF